MLNYIAFTFLNESAWKVLVTHKACPEGPKHCSFINYEIPVRSKLLMKSAAWQYGKASDDVPKKALWQLLY